MKRHLRLVQSSDDTSVVSSTERMEFNMKVARNKLIYELKCKRAKALGVLIGLVTVLYIYPNYFILVPISGVVLYVINIWADLTQFDEIDY